MVEQNICNVNILLTCADMRARVHGHEFLYHTFVPVRTLKDRNGKAPISLFIQTLTLMLYNLINHPNLMGAHRSCGQSVDWTTTNKFARLWFCEDIHHSSILRLAIKKAIQKSSNWNLSSKLFEDDSNNEKNQFVGFVPSHKKGTLLEERYQQDPPCDLTSLLITPL
jgi:hypothetical protein